MAGYKGAQGRKAKPGTIRERLRGREADGAKLRRLPPAPAHLSDVAKAEWERLGRQLREAGLLSKLDAPALALYCVAYARYVHAEEILQGPPGHCPNCHPGKEPTNPPCQPRSHRADPYGEVVSNRLGTRAPSPYLAISDKAWGQMVRILAEFGLTPASRGRVPRQAEPRVRRPSVAPSAPPEDPRAVLGWPVMAPEPN